MKLTATQPLQLFKLANIAAIFVGINAFSSALSQPAPTTPTIAPETPATSTTQSDKITKVNFTFTNLYDYDTCLDGILLLYEGRLQPQMAHNPCLAKIIAIYGNTLSQQQGREIIELANFRATRLLAGKLYPPLGIRRRVAIAFGYIYEMDANDPQMQALAARAGVASTTTNQPQINPVSSQIIPVQ
jgi:hypothetical protein